MSPTTEFLMLLFGLLEVLGIFGILAALVIALGNAGGQR